MSSKNSKTVKRGLFIVFEGIDKAGKTSTSQAIVSNKHFPEGTIVYRRFPNYNNKTGTVIKQYLQNEVELNDNAVHLLFAANFHECMPELNELLNTGISIIVDRYIWSHIVYSITKPGMNTTWIHSINQNCGLLRPDTILFFDVDPEIAAKRGTYSKYREYNAKLQLERDAQKEYYRLRNDSDVKCYTINANEDQLSVQIAAHKVIAQLLNGERCQKLTTL